MSDQSSGVLAFIPARGGSKGIPRKNLCLLAGKPLLAWTIEVALRARNITRVLVSTDDPEIADMARSLGAEVPFLRPLEMAQDNSLLGEAIGYTLERLWEDNVRPEAVVELYPTHPFRTAGMVEALTDQLLRGAAVVSTVRPVSLAPERLLTLDADGTIRRLPAQAIRGRAPAAFRRYGLYHGWRVETGGARHGHVHQITNPVELIDIDTMQDLRLAEAVIRQNLYTIG